MISDNCKYVDNNYNGDDMLVRYWLLVQEKLKRVQFAN